MHRVAERWHGVRHAVRLSRTRSRGQLPRSGALGAHARDAGVAMRKAERHAQRTAGVAGGRLNPDILERPFPLNASVADAVERDAAGHAQLVEPGQLVRRARHLHHHFFGDVLNRSRQVEFPLGQRRLGWPRRTAKQSLEPADRSWSSRGRTRSTPDSAGCSHRRGCRRCDRESPRRTAARRRARAPSPCTRRS